MAGEVDQDVDLIFSNASVQLSVAQADSTDPMICVALEARGEGIRNFNVGVTENLKQPAVVGGKNGLEEERDGMIAEIGGDIADAQRALGRAIVVITARCSNRRGVPRGPAPVFLKDRRRIKGSIVLQRQKQAGMRRSEEHTSELQSRGRRSYAVF